MLQVREYLHPQSDEFADTLPTSIGKWILRTKWVTNTIERLSKNGIILQTTAVHGYVLLYVVSRLKPIRRRSLRFGIEQKRIQSWIDTVEGLMAKDYELAREVAEVASLIKGYGETHRKGLHNFELVMDYLVQEKNQPVSAARIAELRNAALADEDGIKLRAALTSH
jgi:indolepyruvate ferredoxin oxidoreductase beta subunit